MADWKKGAKNCAPYTADGMYVFIFENQVTNMLLSCLLEPWQRNCAAAGAGLRSCPATRRRHMTAGGGSQITTTGSCPSLSLLHAAFD
jgi:hypothetical protein